MDFSLPAELVSYLARLDAFIAAEIAPLQAQDDNQRFFDHRREWARTDFEGGGLPRREWEELLAEARRRADRAGFYRFSLPREYGGEGGSNLWMAVIREHLASQGLGLHNDLQNEHSVVGNFPFIVMMRDFGSPGAEATVHPRQPRRQSHRCVRTDRAAARLRRDSHGGRARSPRRAASTAGRIDGEKMWTTGMHVATHCVVFARTNGEAGHAKGITAFLVPTQTPGVKVEEYLWTFNMPTDHPRVSLTNVWVPDSAVFGAIDNGLPIAQAFVHENRIRQAASSAGRCCLLHQRKRALRPRAQAVRQSARREPGNPVATGRARDASRDAAAADSQDCLGDGPDAAPGS
jgi:acyl-CoA dehydrogenase